MIAAQRHAEYEARPLQDKAAVEITGHRTRRVFDRYNIVDEADVRGAGNCLEQYAEQRKLERVAKLPRVK